MHLPGREEQHQPLALNGYLNRGLSRGSVGLSRVLLRGRGQGGPTGPALARSPGAAGIPHHALPWSADGAPLASPASSRRATTGSQLVPISK